VENYEGRTFDGSHLDPAEIRGLNLVCHCAPDPCHCDHLLELANQPEDEGMEF